MIFFQGILGSLKSIRITQVLGFFLVAGLLAGVGFIYDPVLVRFMLIPPGWGAKIAEAFSFWGDFLTGTLMVGLGLWAMGYGLKKRQWQRAAVACVLAAALAGIAVNCVRLTAGRPRPSAEFGLATQRLGHEPRPLISFGRVLLDGKMEDGIYGLQRPAMFHGFPSGHAATSVGTAAGLSFVVPALGWVAAPLALGVCWSRMALGRHHLSDVLVGAWVGVVAGWLVGRAGRVGRGS
jgi:membrane-associated phospholipid phosphatase